MHDDAATLPAFTRTIFLLLFSQCVPLTGGSESVASLMPTSYFVGRGILLLFSRLLPWCEKHDHDALISPGAILPIAKTGVLCSKLALRAFSDTRNLALLKRAQQYTFISTVHGADVRAFIA
jgi:hypothetical protein